jgi:hypothetical protein
VIAALVSAASCAVIVQSGRSQISDPDDRVAGVQSGGRKQCHGQNQSNQHAGISGARTMALRKSKDCASIRTNATKASEF